MSEPALRGPRWLPPFALAMLIVLLAFDLPSRAAGVEAQSAEAQSAEAQSAEAQSAKPQSAKPQSSAKDIKDTHERLDRIYTRLGIKRKAPKKRKPREKRGCEGDSKGGKMRFSPPSSPAPTLPPLLGYVLIGVVLLAMLLPLILALRGQRDEITTAAAEETEERAETPAPVRGNWDVSFAECRRLLLAGRLTEAFAALHRLTLLSLQEADALQLDATSTNWDYVRRLGGRPPERALLSEVTIAAESAVLGKHPPDAARFDQLEQLLRQRLGGL